MNLERNLYSNKVERVKTYLTLVKGGSIEVRPPNSTYNTYRVYYSHSCPGWLPLCSSVNLKKALNKSKKQLYLKLSYIYGALAEEKRPGPWNSEKTTKIRIKQIKKALTEIDTFLNY